MDGKLKQKQTDMTFQMKVLIYRNQKLLSQYRQHIEEDNVKAAAARTKELLELSASLKKEEEIDEELDTMLGYCADKDIED